MVRRCTPAQAEAVSRLSCSTLGCKVEYFESYVDFSEVLLHRSVRYREGRGWSGRITTELYRVGPGGLPQRV